MKSILHLGLWFLFSSSFAQTYDHNSFTKFQYPQRDMAIVVTNEGYYPDKLILFEGEKVKFFVTSTMNEASCVIVQDQEAFLSATKGKLTEGEMYFNKSGEFEFYCPGYAHKGKVVVLGAREKAQPVVKINRAVASEPGDGTLTSSSGSDNKDWVPRDY